MLKVKVRWQGFTGSPGWSNFFFDDPTGGFTTPEDAVTVSNRVKDFFTFIKPEFPTHVQWAIQSDIEDITTTTGKLNTVINVPAIPTIAGTAPAANYSAASGAVLTWRTGGVRNGRRVRGRTFLVPIATAAFATDGTIRDSFITSVSPAAVTLAGVGSLVPLGVFARPSAPGVEDGAFHPVTGVTIPDKVAVLRSRRD